MFSIRLLLDNRLTPAVPSWRLPRNTDSFGFPLPWFGQASPPTSQMLLPGCALKRRSSLTSAAAALSPTSPWPCPSQPRNGGASNLWLTLSSPTRPRFPRPRSRPRCATCPWEMKTVTETGHDLPPTILSLSARPRSPLDPAHLPSPLSCLLPARPQDKHPLAIICDCANGMASGAIRTGHFNSRTAISSALPRVYARGSLPPTIRSRNGKAPAALPKRRRTQTVQSPPVCPRTAPDANQEAVHAPPTTAIAAASEGPPVDLRSPGIPPPNADRSPPRGPSLTPCFTT